MSGKTISIFLLGLSIIMTIGSVFIFAIGWDKLKKYLESSTIEGHLQFPKIGNVSFHPTITLVGLSNRKIIHLSTYQDQFSRAEIPPGHYKLDISGKGIRSFQQEINIPEKKTLNLGTVALEIDSSDLLKKEDIPPFRIATLGIGPNGSLWATGFKDNGYRVYVKRNNHWNELFISQFKGAIQAVSVHLFSNGIFFVGSIGNGAVVSHDGGNSWESLRLPANVWGVSKAIELPDKSWILVAMGGEKYVKSNGILLKSFNLGRTWKEVFFSEDDIRAIKLLSSNRIIIGTESLSTSASIYYSDDFGESWKISKIIKREALRGITTFLELNNGQIIAGNRDGRHWKGNFLRGSLILKSTDRGLTWSTLSQDENWNGVDALFETIDNKLFAWSGGEVFVSKNNGSSWSSVLHTGSGYRDTLNIIDKDMYIISNENIYKLTTSLDDKALNEWLKSNKVALK